MFDQVLTDDFNCQLQRNVPGCTGEWGMTKRSDGEQMMDLLRENDLFAVGTLFLFRSKKKSGETKSEFATTHTDLKKRASDQGI